MVSCTGEVKSGLGICAVIRSKGMYSIVMQTKIQLYLDKCHHRGGV